MPPLFLAQSIISEVPKANPLIGFLPTLTMLFRSQIMNHVNVVNMGMRIFTFAAFCIFFTNISFAGSWQSFRIEGAQDTYITSIENSLLVGFYNTSANPRFITQGFSLNESSVNFPINYPSAGYTRLLGTDGVNIVGYYNDGVQGFLYDGNTWTSYSSPWPLFFGNQGFYFKDISNGKIIGNYYSESSSNPQIGLIRSFTFTPSNNSWEILTGPNNEMDWIRANGIDGNRIIGNFGSEGFLFDGVTWETLSSPWVNSTFVDISGNNIVGNAGSHGFVFDGNSWDTIQYPDSTSTVITAISGNTIVGYYSTGDGFNNGFIHTIPEPSSLLLLLGIGIPLTLRLLKPKFTKREF